MLFFSQKAHKAVSHSRFMALPDGAMYINVERLVLCVAGVYVACAGLRLARFNVENVPDESAHMSFSGLPSPGAAFNIAALVLMFEHVQDKHWLPAPALSVLISIALPVITLFVALLMVSRVRYPHLVNQYIRGKRPFNYLVKLVLVALAMMLDLWIAVALLSLAYTLMGPIRALLRRITRKPPAPAVPGA